MQLGRADRGGRGRRARDAAHAHALEVLQQVERHERVRALVGRLLLHPGEVGGARIVAERLRDFVDLNPEFETPIERFATWLARLDDADED